MMKKLLFIITFTVILLPFLLTTPCPAKQMNILVHPFENTGEKEHSWVSAGMTDSVIADLTRISNISVVSNQDRKNALEEMKFILSGLVEEDRMIKLGKLTGANVIFTGSYLVSGSRIRVYARLVNVESGKVENSTKIDGTLNGIFDLQDKVVFALMGETEKITIADIKPVKITEQDKKQIEEKPKPNVTAYEWYAKGLEIQYTNPKEALTNFKKALDIDPNYTDALMQAGWTEGNMLSLFSEALGYFEKAERIFQSRNETKSVSYANLLKNISSVYWSKGQFDRALEYSLNSKSIYELRRLENTAGYANLLMLMGGVSQSKNQLDRAMEYFLNSQTIHNRLGLQNTASYANLLLGIGAVYAKKGQLDRAMEYYMNSQSLYNKLGLQDTTGYASLMVNIGIVYRSKGQLDRAMEYFLNSQSIYNKLGLQDAARYANIMGNIGGVYWSKNQLDLALEYYLKSQSIMDSLGLQNTAGYANLMYGMAVLYEKQGKRDLAGRYYRLAYDTSERAEYSGEWKKRALNSAKRLGY